jgi:hypothetical protein
MRRAPRRPAGAMVLAALLGGLAWGTAPGAAEPPPSNPHGSYVEECSLCHRADAWVPARISPKFDHAKSGFPLEGAHAQSSCRGCHASLDFTKAKPKSSCIDCHEDVHQGELGQDCVRCHTARSFIDRARMARAHDLTRFPLVGAHRVADCESCHRPASPGNLAWVGLSIDCVACHLADYTATTNPSHVAGGFPQDCTPCHSPVAWDPARFPEHDALYFPIFSGTHRSQWRDCSDCHVNRANFVQFECILCHAHSDSTEVAGQHSGVGGYAYNSPACYGCHPDGRK